MLNVKTMSIYKRICLIVLDSCGCGELPDAGEYGDIGSNTLKHTEDTLGELKIPNLLRLGFGELAGLKARSSIFDGYFAKLTECSVGKDTATGHLEMMGLPVTEAFSYFPAGFPQDFIDSFLKTNRLDGFLGNKPASGTEIIKELGEEHLKTGYPIIYTSGDSVFQIAWHEKKFGIDRLYEICKNTRKLLSDSQYHVGRVIARPFVGDSAETFRRTDNRKDYALDPHGITALDKLMKSSIPTIGIGKVPSIYNYQGISEIIAAKNDEEAIQETINALNTKEGPCLIFSNFNDLDMLYGHRRDPKGYGKRLEFIDQKLNDIKAALRNDDLLLITADHGNDPTYRGTDHTREYVPLAVYSPSFQEGSLEERNLGVRKTFADIGASVLDNFNVEALPVGESFLSKLKAAS